MATKRELVWQKAKQYKTSNIITKSRILDDLVSITGYSRKHTTRLLRLFGTEHKFRGKNGTAKILAERPTQRRPGGGRKKQYGPSVLKELEKLWVRFEYPCGKLLAAILRDPVCLAGSPPELQEKLMSISPATIDRLLKKKKDSISYKKGQSHTKGGPLKTLIPIRTFSSWKDVGIGHLQIDHVGHEGGSAAGEFAFTLNTTDVKSGWTLLYAVKNKARKWTFNGLVAASRDYPFTILEFHPDNDSSFINYHLKEWCDKNDILLTRSRPYKKNDNHLVEQKNDAVVRRYVGYHRYEGDDAVSLLNDLYQAVNLMVNHFIPQRRLVKKERIGAKVKKHYDQPMSPYQRLMALSNDDFDELSKNNLKKIHDSLDPIALSKTIKDIQRRLIRLSISGTKLL